MGWTTFHFSSMDDILIDQPLVGRKPQTAVGVVTGEGRDQHTEVEKAGNVELQCSPHHRKCPAEGYRRVNNLRGMGDS